MITETKGLSGASSVLQRVCNIKSITYT